MTFVPSVVIIDHTTKRVSDDLDKYAHAYQDSLDFDFSPIYLTGANVRADVKLGEADWALGLFDDPDQVGALGYHGVGPNGLPFGKVFPWLDAQDGVPLSRTIHHELLELILDALCDRSRATVKGFAADEPCDPVEADEGYTRDGVALSNFVTPAWYRGGAGPYDFLKLCTAALEVRPGGYAQFNTGSGWQPVYNAYRAPRAYRMADFGRSAQRRAMPLAA